MVAVVGGNQDKVTGQLRPRTRTTRRISYRDKSSHYTCLKRPSVFKIQFKRIQHEASCLSTHPGRGSIHIQDSLPILHPPPLRPVLLQVGRADRRLQLQGGHGGPLQQCQDLPKAGQPLGQGLLQILLLPALQTLPFLGSLLWKMFIFSLPGITATVVMNQDS